MVLFSNNTPMRRSSFVFVSSIFLSIYVHAQNPQRAFMEQFQSSRISFPSEEDPILADSPGRYPQPFNFLFENVMSWIPRGEPKLMSLKCQPDLWQERLKDIRIANSPQLQGALVQKYFQDCREDLETKDNGYFSNVIKMMTMKYSPQKHPFLRRVVVNLPGNVKLKGLLGLKGDMKRRPLVILRLGIFSNVEDFKPERAWMMMLFEQSPFNVLMLENMSSADFVNNNNQFSFGGYDEGIQNIQVARLLVDPLEPLSQLIDSVHVFGVSLGGHGVLFSSLLNKYNSPAGNPLINSFIGVCPVVNLKPTMQALTEGGVSSAFVDLWSRQRLVGLDKKIPSLVTYDSFSFLSKAISEIARTYHGGLSYVSSVKLPPGMKDSADFWGVNDFWKFYKDVQQPVLILATEQDPAVPFALNSQLLANKEMKVESKNIRVVDLPEGVHCTLPVPYDWSALAAIYQAYILSHSPQFKLQEREIKIDLNDEEWTDFLDVGSRVQFTVEEPNKKSGFVTLSLEIENAKGKDKTMNLSLPLSQFDFQFRNPELSGSEQEMIVRWIYQNVRFKIQTLAGKHALQATWKVAE